MKKINNQLFILFFCLTLFTFNGFSQEQQEQNDVTVKNKEALLIQAQTGVEKTTNQVEVLKKDTIVDEYELSTINPVILGFELILIDGQEVYFKQEGKISIIYNPNN